MCTTITKKQTAKDWNPKRVVTAYKVVDMATVGGVEKSYALFRGSPYASGWMKAEEDWSRSGDSWTRSGLAAVGQLITGSAFHCMPTKHAAKNFLAALKRTRKHGPCSTANAARLAKVKLRGCVAYGKGVNVCENLNGYPSIVGREMRIVRVYKNNR